MPIELLQDTVSSVEVLMTDGTGSLVTGIAAKPTVYIVKADGAVTVMAAANFGWAELDATNAPGLYRLTFNATGVANSFLDTVGRFIISIKASAGPPAYIQQYVYAEIKPMYLWDYLRRIRGWQQLNFRIKPTVWDSTSKNITAATIRVYPSSADATADINQIETATIAATYNPDGSVASYLITV